MAASRTARESSLIVVRWVGPGQEGEVAVVRKEVQVRRVWVGDLWAISFLFSKKRDLDEKWEGVFLKKKKKRKS